MSARTVTQDVTFTWDGVSQRLGKGQVIDVVPGGALEAAIGAARLVPYGLPPVPPAQPAPKAVPAPAETPAAAVPPAPKPATAAAVLATAVPRPRTAPAGNKDDKDGDAS
jgi:cell division septation protein DedD